MSSPTAPNQADTPYFGKSQHIPWLDCSLLHFSNEININCIGTLLLPRLCVKYFQGITQKAELLNQIKSLLICVEDVPVLMQNEL